MVYIDGNFVGWCSGTMLADVDTSTQKPWFYSANHCLDNEDAPHKTPAQMQVVANSITMLWLFQASSCGSLTPDPAFQQVSGGAIVTYSNLQNDNLLLLLNKQPPSGVFFSGWDSNSLSSGTAVTIIHHPQGDLKKVSLGTALGAATPSVDDVTGSFNRVRWTSGSTEPGSSGGGLFTVSNGQYLLRGGLWGGSASCTDTSGSDYFSRFDNVYPILAPYIGPAIAPSGDFTDLWWNPSESGWGLSLVQHASHMMFGVWYTYEPDGTRTWYVMPSGTWITPNSYTGVLYQTNGPPFTAGAFNPANVQNKLVGSATLAFTSSSAGTFTFLVDGVTGTKSIQRQPY
jgi:lysyl endopeptidase